MVTDGKVLKVSIEALDTEPEKLTTFISDTGKYPAIWKEDSFELFFKPKPDYPEQFQFIISNTGAYVQNRNQHLDGGKYKRLPWPKKEEATVRVKRHKSGYTIDLDVPLAIMAFTIPLKPGDAIYGQIVRNFRAHQSPERQILQLFPTAIYIKKGTPPAGTPPANHHPKGFQPYRLILPKR